MPTKVLLHRPHHQKTCLPLSIPHDALAPRALFLPRIDELRTPVNLVRSYRAIVCVRRTPVELRPVTPMMDFLPIIPMYIHAIPCYYRDMSVYKLYGLLGITARFHSLHVRRLQVAQLREFGIRDMHEVGLESH